MRGKWLISVAGLALAVAAMLSSCSSAGAGGSSTTGSTGGQTQSVYTTDVAVTNVNGQPVTTAPGGQGDNVVVVDADFFDRDDAENDAKNPDVQPPETLEKTTSTTTAGGQPATTAGSETTAGGQQPSWDEWSPNY